MFTRTILALATAAAVVIAAACGGTTSTPSPSVTAQPTATPIRLIVGAIHVGSIKDAGYNQAQHEGLVWMTQHVPGVKLLEAENVPEGPDVERVMENMIGQGATLIFPQSFGYMDFALNVAQRHPDVKFEHPAGYKLADNFGTYWAASDQLTYVLGVSAGLSTKTNTIAFVGAMPIPQVLASVNAFHLGARSVNPKVETRAVFTGTWSDPAKEAAATNAVIDQGADVVTMLVDSPITVVQTAEKRGVRSIGYHSSAVAEFAPNGWISGVNFGWGPFFERQANAVIDGTWKSENYIGPVATGMANLAPWGKNVPETVKTTVASKLTAFQSGELPSPYVGPVYDQAGGLRIRAGEVPSPDFVNTVDWFAQGVVGQPK
jgi:basic membrane protein A and related proteins